MIKSKIRKKILAIRKKKNTKYIKFLFSNVLKEIDKKTFKKKILGVYYPVNFEIDIFEIFKKLEIKGQKLCLPVVKKNNQMDFYSWSTKNLLKINKYGIPEPEQIKKIFPDIILVPLVAFDIKLYRLGYGGGYYDRYIDKISKKKKLLKIGIAHSCQKINRVPVNKYDKKLDIIITEKYVLKWKFFFLGDIVGKSGRLAVIRNLKDILKKNKIDFVVVNGENAADQGVGITETISNDLFNSGVDVITTGNHVWDQKETVNHIEREKRLLRPENLSNSPGNGFGVYKSKNGFRIGVLNLMGNVFMKKCNDVFETAITFKNKYKLQEDYDFLVVDFHGEITSEKMAMGHFFDGKATLVVGTHTHVPTNDLRILINGTAYQTDAGMCGDYDSVIGMNKQNSLNRFLKKDSIKHFPADGNATLCGLIVECNTSSGLANRVETFIYGGELINNN